jgi:hypothetical protein
MDVLSEYDSLNVLSSNFTQDVLSLGPGLVGIHDSINAHVTSFLHYIQGLVISQLVNGEEGIHQVGTIAQRLCRSYQLRAMGSKGQRSITN